MNFLLTTWQSDLSRHVSLDRIRSNSVGEFIGVNADPRYSSVVPVRGKSHFHAFGPVALVLPCVSFLRIHGFFPLRQLEHVVSEFHPRYGIHGREK